MRVLLCCAAAVAALALAGCGGSSPSSDSGKTQATHATTHAAKPQPVLHYITREVRPRNPGPHPGARVERLIVREIRRGKGPAIRAGDTGIFEFIATDWITGRAIESSWHRRRPFETKIEHNVVIDGWWQGIPGMRVGGRRQIIIPPSLGFTTNPDLQSETTFFDVTLVQITPQQPPAGGGS